MNIGKIHLYGRSFPPEIRLEKESNVLIKSGHQVTVLTHKISDKESSHEIMQTGLVVKREIINIPNLFFRLISFFTLRNKYYYLHIDKFIQNEKPDVLHVHDFTVVPTVLHVASKYGIPVIADLHENMPAALKAYRSSYPLIKRFIHAVFFNYFLWKWHEKRTLIKCEKIFVVVPEAAQRLIDYGIPENKIVIISNTEDENTFQINPERVDSQIVNKFKDHWMVSYIGGMGPHRGLDTTLRALPYIRDKIPKFVLVIVGLNEYQKKEVLLEAHKMACENMVQVIEWQPFEKVNSYIFASRVCLVPHNDFEHTHTTVPHKLFQYMICGKPVLVSSCKPLKRIVEDAQSGKVFQSNNAQDFSDKLIQMYDNKDELRLMGENGRKNALNKYSWKHDAKKLLNAYKDITV